MEKNIRAQVEAGKAISKEELEAVKSNVVEKFNRLVVNNDQLSPQEKKAWGDSWRVAIDCVGFKTSSPVVSTDEILRNFLTQIGSVFDTFGISPNDEKYREISHELKKICLYIAGKRIPTLSILEITDELQVVQAS